MFWIVRLIILLNILLFCLTARTFPVKSVIEYVLVNNPEIELAQYKLAIAKTNYQSSFSNFLPNINAEFQQGKQRNNAKNTDRGELDKLQDLEIHSITLTQPLFKGFQNFNQKKIAKFNLKEEENLFLEKQENIILAAIKAYLELYRLNETINTHQTALKLSQEHQEIIEDRQANGFASNTELIEYKIKENALRQDLLLYENQQNKAKQEYIAIVGKIDDDLTITDINFTEKILTLDDYLLIANDNNKKLRQYYFKFIQAKINHQKAKGAFLPEANFIFERQTQQNVVYLENKDLDSKTYYFQFSVPLFQQGSEYSSLKQAKQQMQYAEIEYKTEQRKLQNQITQKFNEISYFNNQLLQLTQNMEFIKQRLSQNESLIKQGQANKIDDILIKMDLIEVEKQIITAKIQSLYANIEFNQLIGEELL